MQEQKQPKISIGKTPVQRALKRSNKKLLLLLAALGLVCGILYKQFFS